MGEIGYAGRVDEFLINTVFARKIREKRIRNLDTGLDPTDTDTGIVSSPSDPQA